MAKSPPPPKTEGRRHKRYEVFASVQLLKGEETLILPGGPTVNRVNVTKPDGTGVLVEAQNTARDGSALPDGSVTWG